MFPVRVETKGVAADVLRCGRFPQFNRVPASDPYPRSRQGGSEDVSGGSSDLRTESRSDPVCAAPFPCQRSARRLMRPTAIEKRSRPPAGDRASDSARQFVCRSRLTPDPVLRSEARRRLLRRWDNDRGDSPSDSPEGAPPSWHRQDRDCHRSGGELRRRCSLDVRWRLRQDHPVPPHAAMRSRATRYGSPSPTSNAFASLARLVDRSSHGIAETRGVLRKPAPSCNSLVVGRRIEPGNVLRADLSVSIEGEEK